LGSWVYRQAPPKTRRSLWPRRRSLITVHDEWRERLSGRGGLAGLRADLPIERYPRLLLFDRWVAAWLESSGQHWAAGTLFRSDAACISSLSDQTTAALVADVYPQPVEDNAHPVAQADQEINVRETPDPPGERLRIAITEIWTAAGAGKRPSMDRTICQGSSAGLARMVETLSSAFQHDPALSWILPDPAQRQLRLPKLFDLVVRSDLAAGSALRSNAFEVVTLWRAPGKAHVGLWKPFCRDLAIFELLVLHWVAPKPSYARWNRTTPKATAIGTCTMPACVRSIRVKVGGVLRSSKV
jgi:hypothetical protein